jgi:anti-anti-sigma factor
MKITERDEKSISIFRPQGRVDSQGSVFLDEALQAAITAGKYKIVLDMTEVDYISSAGLRTLADISTKTAEKEGGFKLVALHRKVLRVFRIIGFDKLFDIYDTVEAAIDAF